MCDVDWWVCWCVCVGCDCVVVGVELDYVEGWWYCCWDVGVICGEGGWVFVFGVVGDECEVVGVVGVVVRWFVWFFCVGVGGEFGGERGGGGGWKFGGCGEFDCWCDVIDSEWCYGCGVGIFLCVWLIVVCVFCGCIYGGGEGIWFFFWLFDVIICV